jgi:ribonuclease VapC
MPSEINEQAGGKAYVLDSYAVLAYLEGEGGSDHVGELLEAARNGRCRLFMSVINLGEVLYIVERERGLPMTHEVLARIDELPIEIVNADRTLTLAAAHLKAECPIAYADCFAAALSQVKEAALVTGDREFRQIDPGITLEIDWLPET